MVNKLFQVKGRVEIFPVKNPWVYIGVPEKYSKILKTFAERGLIAIRVTLGKSSWDTSLMPMGNGTHFIPLNAKIRKVERIKIGDIISLSFVLRER
jgi:hypothetical protein